MVVVKVPSDESAKLNLEDAISCGVVQPGVVVGASDAGVKVEGLSGHPITNKDTVDIGVRVLNRTGLFGEEYKAWILRGDDDKT